MSDETTSGFTGIVEDASSANDPERFLSITVNDFLGDSLSANDAGLTSYVNLGAWTPSTTAGTVVDGKLDDGERDDDDNPTPEAHYTLDRATGDDLLAAFLYDGYLDDVRDRFDADAVEEANKRATPGVNFAAFAQPPKVASFHDASDPDLTDGNGFFPASAVDEHFFYSEAARQRLTEYTPATVGWRDHTEGHRITTTRGDKLEVIGGNYKLIVLGRGSGTVQSDWSGGHRVDVMEAPGLVTSINWRQVPTGDSEDERGWLWVEETVKGHVIDRYHGTVRTEHYGDDIIEIIGRSDADAPVAVAESADDMGAFGALGDRSRGAQRFAELDNPWDGTAGSPPERSRPRVARKVRARSVFEREQYDEDDISIATGRTIQSFAGASPNLDQDGRVIEGGGMFAPDVQGRRTRLDREIVRAVGDNSRIDTRIEAKDVREELSCDYYLGHNQAALHREYWGGRFRERFIGSFTQLFAAAYVTLGVAVRTETCTGLELLGNVGAYQELKLVEFNVSLACAKYAASKLESRVLNKKAEITEYANYIQQTNVQLADWVKALLTNKL